MHSTKTQPPATPFALAGAAPRNSGPLQLPVLGVLDILLVMLQLKLELLSLGASQGSFLRAHVSRARRYLAARHGLYSKKK